uniref:Uncharacterized protein n=1 Tax=Tanacetum cinerariifolium TaxID=118510 RepID=A0A699GKG2_TANCI|nr:hypothetical protein [Tanacetum cinerariifolium]
MSTPKFVDVHNLVAFLSKPTESKGFEQIIEFLNANPIKYALTMNPTVYTSCIEQFSATATAKNINREVQIHAKVDGKKVIIFEATIRKDLKFKDKGGVDCLSNEVIFEQLPLMRKETPLFPTMLVPAQEEELGKGSTMPSAPQHIPINQPSTSKPQKKQKPRKPRRQEPEETQPSGPTTNVAYEALNEKNVLTQSNDLPLSRVNTLRSGEDTLKLNELMELCTKLSDRVLNLETTKTAQAKEISSLKRRVKRLEKTKRSRTHGRKRLYKIGLSARVESSAEEQSLVNKTTKDQGRYNDEEMFDIDVINNVEVVVKDVNIVGIATAVTAAITTDVFIDDITLAQALVEIKTSKPKARGIIMLEPSETSTTTTIPIYLKVQDKGKGYRKKSKELTIKEKSRLFVELMDKRKKHFAKLRAEEQRRNLQPKLKRGIKLVKDKAVLTHESSSKRAGDKLDQERSKKQKVEDDKESEELKRCLEIILDDGDDVTIDAIPLSIKTPFIDYKIYKEGKKSYFQIFRGDENSQMYILSSQQGLTKVKSWELFDSYEVHCVSMQNTVYYLLVEKMYPLTNHTLHQMFNNVKLQVDEEYEMAYKLLRLVKKQLKEGYRAN